MKIAYITGTTMDEQCNSLLFRKILKGDLRHHYAEGGYPELSFLDNKDILIVHGLSKEGLDYLHKVKKERKNLKIVMITCHGSNWMIIRSGYDMISYSKGAIDLFMTPHLDHIDILKGISGIKTVYFPMPINLDFYKRVDKYIKGRVEFGIGGLNNMRGYIAGILASKKIEEIEKITLGVAEPFNEITKKLAKEFNIKLFPFNRIPKDYVKLLSTVDCAYIPMHPLSGNSRSVLERAALGIPTITTPNILTNEYEELKVNYWEVDKAVYLLKEILSSTEFRDKLNAKAREKLQEHDLPNTTKTVKKLLEEL